MPAANDIRAQFIDFFKAKHAHTFVPSSSVVPLDDPTLMFTNAGMNQFKDVFLGAGSRPYQRAVNSQKCIRASGKHNDLEDVGRDTYHHTFFEMLGNWSFGDYYKAEAIRWAWELLTQVWGIDKTRLHATVFGGDAEFKLEADEEAAKLWTSVTDIDPTHVHRFGKKDNFWMMGETGPCGPCTEIHIDRTPDKSGGHLVNAGDARVMEIWNLVFIQYNRDDAGVLTPLPAKHVDTGMGFERLCAVLQGKDSNYDTDVFAPIMAAIEGQTGKKYTSKLDDLQDTAFRVIADHLRTLTFAITDGALPGNKGRGSVLRSILRRAVRFGWQVFGQREPFIHKLVPALVHHMGGAFPELMKNPGRVAEVIEREEADFLRTIERGLDHFNEAAQATVKAQAQAVVAAVSKLGFQKQFDAARLGADEILKATQMPEHLRMLKAASELLSRQLVETQAGKQVNAASVGAKELRRRIPGASLFKLHATYGFPLDLTRQMANELELEVDEDEYNRLMKEHEDISRATTGAKQVALNVSTPLPTTDDRPKWYGPQTSGKLLGWIADNAFIEKGKLLFDKDGIAATVGLILDSTCFYAESGGQVGDVGLIVTPTGKFVVSGTQKLGNAVVHVGEVAEGHLEAGQQANLKVSGEREFTRRNHTATHLLHWALRTTLGEHVEQRGSKVKPDGFTFDFSHDAPVTKEQKVELERLVNEKIYRDLPVAWRELPIAEAKTLPGVRAFFGDKYGDVVRVVEIADPTLSDSKRTDGKVEEVFSREFCGGTHLDRTGQAGFFMIVGEEAVGKGVRRLTAVTAREAVRAVQHLENIVGELAGRFRCPPADLPARVEALQEEVKKLQQQAKKGATADLSGTADKLFAAAVDVGGAKVIVGELPAAPDEAIRVQVDRIKQKMKSGVVVFGWAPEEGKVSILVAVTDDLQGKVQAGKLVGQVAPLVGGKGGGRPGLAQAGGKDASKLAEALAEAKGIAEKALRG